MPQQALLNAFADWSTPLVADACVRLGVPLRLAPAGVRPVAEAHRVAGPVLPVRHYGSVDIFLEAMGEAERGDVLVIDNGGAGWTRGASETSPCSRPGPAASRAS